MKYANNLYKKANYQMRLYIIIQSIIIIAGAAISIVNVAPTTTFAESIQMASAILGGIVVVFTAFNQLLKPRDAGLIFRNVISNMQREYHSFIFNINEYSPGKNIDDEKYFIKKSEDLIYQANTEYYGLFRETNMRTLIHKSIRKVKTRKIIMARVLTNRFDRI